MSFRTAVHALLICVLAVWYFTAGRVGILSHTDPTEMDTVAYLAEAVEIRESGGIAAWIPNAVTGKYTEATQHPLYLLLLSPFAEKDIRFFVNAKIATFVVGLVFLIALGWMVWNLYGPAASFVTLTLAVMNATFIHMTTMIACESLMALFFMAFWFFAAKGFGSKPQHWVTAGVFASLTFLTKSLGILCLPIFVLAAVWIKGKKSLELLKQKHFWGFFLAFVVVASPLLVRNVVVYGSPLYSDSSAVMWIDRWDEFSYERAKEGRFGLKQYLQTHDMKNISGTLQRGLLNRNPRMISDGLKPLPFWSGIQPDMLSGFHHPTVKWQGAWALWLVVGCITGWVLCRDAAAKIAAVSFGIFFVFVGWYSKIFDSTPPTRLLYCVLFFILIYSGYALSRGLLHRLAVIRNDGKGLHRVSAVVLVCFIAYGAYGTFVNFEGKIKDIRQSYDYGVLFKIQMNWLRGITKPGDLVLTGGTFGNPLFYFQNMPFKVQEWPKLDNLEQMIGFIQENKVRYGVLDLATVLYNSQVFGEYFSVNPQSGLVPKKPLPPPFVRMPRDPKMPAFLEMYRFEEKS